MALTSDDLDIVGGDELDLLLLNLGGGRHGDVGWVLDVGW
jgi:hypothetical protein